MGGCEKWEVVGQVKMAEGINNSLAALVDGEEITVGAEVEELLNKVTDEAVESVGQKSSL